MQKIIRIFLMLTSALWVVGCNQTKLNNDADKKAIQKMEQTYQETYNQQDATKFAALWSSNAFYSNPLTGETAEGREAIEKLFKEKFAQTQKRHLDIQVKSIEFPSADEAVENGVMKVTLLDQPPLEAAYQLEYIKENGKWMINNFHEINLLEPSSNFEQLKDLEWMIGKWEDSDENVQISFDNKWDKYKNFITQNFKMKIYGTEDIEGKQIIAWDPAKNIIRSWVFDSEGGFGEGTWEKLDKSWYATMHFTLSDGRLASSKNIYTPIDNHSYTFTSEEREVDGEILPNMNPVTVEKIE